MKQTLLSLIAIVALTGCGAAETNHPVVAAKEVKAEIDSWANVPGGVVVRRITNDVPVRQEMQYVKGQPVKQTTEFNQQVFIAPIQVVQWLNESNVYESVEWPLIQPRLLSETLRTNVVTK